MRAIVSTPSGSGAKKKREYIYFKNLEFLRKVVASRPTVSTIPEEETETASAPKPEKPSSRKRLVGQDKNSKFEEELLSHLTQGSCDSESVHVSFIKFLLPTLETFSADETLDFQGEVLNLVRNIKRQRLLQMSHAHQNKQNYSHFSGHYIPRPAAPMGSTTAHHVPSPAAPMGSTTAHVTWGLNDPLNAMFNDNIQSSEKHTVTPILSPTESLHSEGFSILDI